MKKLLLSLATVALTATASWANELTVNFEGDKDLYGLTRFTTTTQANLTFAQEVPITEDGVELKFSDSAPGLGWALINAGGLNNGLCAYSNFSAAMHPEIELKVPGGTIENVKLYISGTSANNLKLSVSAGTLADEPTEIQSNYVYFSWSDESGVETVKFDWTNNYYPRYIHKIEVTYTPDLGGKEECGLAFDSKTADGFMGETFTAPVLSNPNDLPITWTSSDEAVATVNEDGEVTLLSKGTTYITATTEGNDDYAAGKASYELTVYPVANSIAQMYELAPATNDQVKVNIPLTVYYVSPGNKLYVMDKEERGAQIIDAAKNAAQEKSVYTKGSIIPAGWIATTDAQQAFSGTLEAPTDTVEVTYPEVTSIDKEMANLVVVLKNVTFTTPTPAGTSQVNGVTAEGETYQFQNPFGAPEMAAGTYDVTGVVMAYTSNNREYFYMAPIEYSKDPVFPETFEVAVSSETLTIEKEEEDEGYRITISGSCAEDKATVEVTVPEGWDGFIGMSDSDYTEDTEYSNLSVKRKAAAEANWTPVDVMLQYGFKKTNSFEFPVDGEEHSGKLYLYKGENVDMANEISVDFQAEKATVEVKPTFPEEFIVAVSDPNVTDISQDGEDEDYMISISGESEEETITVTLETPEGWDGFYGFNLADMSGENPDGPSPWRVRALAEAEEDGMWISVEELQEEMPVIKEGNSLTFKVGERIQYGYMFLYKGEMAYFRMIQVAAEIEKIDTPEPEIPTFPETFDVKLSSNCEALKLTQGDDQGVYTIKISGECDKEEVTVTIAIPEGWTGLIGLTDGDYTPDVNNDPLMAKAVATAADDDDMAWAPIDMLKQIMEGIKEGNVFTFPVDDEYHQGSFYLYKDDMAYMTQQIQIEFEVTYNIEAGIANIEAADSDARYFNLQGVEVKNPEAGVYVKVANGKVSKVTVK